MAKSYSEEERVYIKNNLISQAELCIKKYGMKKTTVDELTRRCRIAKGSFYHFYTSKELLFWDVIVKWHKEIQQDTMKTISEMKQITVDTMTDLIYGCYIKCFELGLGEVMCNKELEDLIPKLPKEVLQENGEMDQDFMAQIFTLIPGGEHLDMELYSGVFDGIFLILLYREQLQNRFEDILRVTIRGIVIQILQEVSEKK